MTDKIITIPERDGQQSESFVWEDVPGDGDCFYESIARLVNIKRGLEMEESVSSVRYKVAKYIFDNWDTLKTNLVIPSIIERETKYKDFSKVDVNFNIQDDELQDNNEVVRKQYCKLLSEPRKLGVDGVSIKVAREVLKVNIIIVNKDGNPINEISNVVADGFPTIYLRYLGANHYQPLINLKDKTYEMAKIWKDNIRQNVILEQLLLARDSGNRRNIEVIEENELQEMILKYLNGLDNENLKKFYKYLFKLSAPKEAAASKKKQPEMSYMFSGIFESLANMFSNPVFIESLMKLFAGFRTIFHKIMVTFNPGIEFEESEQKKELYGQYSKIFSLTGEEGRKLYRKLLKKIDNKELSLTKEQFLNVLLHKLRKDKKDLFSKVGHAIMTKIEKEIFKDLKEKEEQNEQLAVIIEKNLRKGYQAYLKAYLPQEEDEYASWDDFEDLFEDAVQIIKGNVSTLKREIDKLIDQIKDPNEGLSNKQKVELWTIIQQDRLKLSHFMLKTKAFSEGNVLTPKKKQEFGLVFENFLRKFNTQSIIDIHSVGEQAAVVVPEEERKSILRLFVNGNKYDYLVSEDKFTKTLRKAKESRSEEIKQAIEVQNNQITMALRSLRDVDLPEELQDGATGTGLNLRLRGLKILDEVGDFLDINSYNEFKQKLIDNAQKLANLEKIANPWINSHNANAAAATRNLA